MNIRFQLCVAAAALALVTGSSAAPTTPSLVKNIVLVHGAFADGSGWAAVANILRRDGFNVSVAQPPETSLDDDVASTNRTIDAMAGQVVLVGHSYGGVIITAAGNNEHVKSLVYVAAFQPDAGESLGSLAAGKHRHRAAPSRHPMATCIWTARASMPTSAPTCRKRKPRSWPGRRSVCRSRPLVRRSLRQRGRTSRASRSWPPTIGRSIPTSNDRCTSAREPP